MIDLQYFFIKYIKKNHYLLILFPMLLSVIVFFLVWNFGNTQFTGMDGGVLINSAYQMFLGYRPYIDIITAVPPAFLIGGKLAFLFFGIKWSSLVVLVAIFTSGSFLLHVYILRKLGINKILCVLIALYCQSVTSIMTSYWWYNQITISTAALFVSSALLFYKYPNRAFSKISFISLGVILFLMKVNIAFLMIFLTYLVLIIFNFKKIWQIISILILSIIITLSIFILFQINPSELIINYLYSSTRAFSLRIWIQHLFYNYPWESLETYLFSSFITFAFCLSTIDIIRFKIINRHNIPFILFSLISIIVGIFGIGTNNNFKMVDGSLIILGMIFVIVYRNNFVKDRLFKVAILSFTVASILLFIFSGMYKGFTRFNLREALAPGIKGVGVFYDGSSNNPPLKLISNVFFFSSLKSGPYFQKTLNEINFVIRTAKDVNPKIVNNILIGPRIDFSYAVFNINPPKGFPLWWEPFEFKSFNSKINLERTLLINKFKSKNFKLAIFLHHDYTFYPSELILYLNNEYNVYDYGGLTIYILKKEKSLNSLKKILKKG